MSKVTKWLGVAFVASAAALTAGIVVAAVTIGYENVSDEPVLVNEASELQNNAYKGNGKKLDVVALGDSVTAGYTTLAFEPGQQPRDERDGSYAAYLSRILAEQKAHSLTGRLNSFTNLAVSGAKTADLLAVVNDPQNASTLANADLFVGTIGANDILQSVLVAGLPYRNVADVITGNPLVFEPGSLATYLAAPDNMQAVFDGKMSGLFRPDFDTKTSLGSPTVRFNKIYADMLANFETTLLLLHQKAPRAEIIFNKYIYPFNRFLQNGKNVTDEVYDSAFQGSDADKYATVFGFPSYVTTFKGAFNYIMTQLQAIVKKYSFAVWNDMQLAEDQIVHEMETRKQVVTEAEGYALLQADKIDIHPTELAHAFTAQKLYNSVLADQLGEKTSGNTYDAVVTKVRNATLGAHVFPNTFADFLLKNTGTQVGSPDNFFVGKLAAVLIDRIQKPLTQAVVRALILSGTTPSLADVFASTPYGPLYTVVNAFLSGQPVDQKQAQYAFDQSMQDIFYGGDQKSADALAAFIYPHAFAPVSLLEGATSLDPRAKLVQEAAMTPLRLNGNIYKFWSGKLYNANGAPLAGKDHDRQIVKESFGFGDDDVATAGALAVALERYYLASADWQSEQWKGPSGLTGLDDPTIVDDVTKQGGLLRDWVGIANAFADMFPQAFYDGYTDGSNPRPLLLTDLTRDANGDFVMVKI